MWQEWLDDVMDGSGRDSDVESGLVVFFLITLEVAEHISAEGGDVAIGCCQALSQAPGALCGLRLSLNEWCPVGDHSLCTMKLTGLNLRAQEQAESYSPSITLSAQICTVS